MKIAVTGGLGFLGRNLVPRLIREGHDVTVFDNIEESRFHFDGACYVRSDLTRPGSWQNFMGQQDAVVNLAGVNIFQRWNESRKSAIMESRIQVTANIIDALESSENSCDVLINASAVGFYGLHGDENIDEKADAGGDFLAIVAKNWEKEALRAEKSNIRVVLMRFGTIFGSDGGAFPELKKNFRRFTGAVLGSGKQWFPWIHMDDLLEIIILSLSDKGYKGPVNCVSPGRIRNRELTRVMKENVRRFSLVPFVPGFMLRLLLGEFGSYVVKGQNVIPGVLMSKNFQFKYESFEKAVKNLLETDEKEI